MFCPDETNTMIFENVLECFLFGTDFIMKRKQRNDF